jgi:hypothetical protein
MAFNMSLQEMAEPEPDALFANPQGNHLVEAARRNLGVVNQRGANAFKHLGSGYETGRSYLSQMAGQFEPTRLRSYRGANLYADALGVGGQAGQDRARAAFQTGPGYQFGVDEALQGAARAASAGGMLSSGNLIDASTRIAHGLANKEYGSWLDRLAGYDDLELAAASGRAGAFGNLANMAYGYGADRAGIESAIAEGEMGAFNQAGTAIEQRDKEEKDRKAALINSILGLAGKGLGFLGGMMSDRRTKRDITRIGTLPNGLPWYSFRYRHEGPDGPLRQGVMADEVAPRFPDAVVTRGDGVRFVKYGMIL